MYFLKSPFFYIVILAFILRVLIAYSIFNNPNVFIQQDHYADYADALVQNTINTPNFSAYDTQLFPGYPLIIILFMTITSSSIYAGLLISLISSMGAIYLMQKLFKDYRITALTAFFPPMWLEQAGEVSTEPIFVFICLLSILLSQRKRYLLAGILIGLSFIIKPVGICLFGVIILKIAIKKQYNALLMFSLGFILMLGGILAFNILVFGQSGVLKQFISTSRYEGLRLGILQLPLDFYQVLFELKDYKFFLSGLFYVISNIASLVALYFNRNRNEISQIFFYWFLLTLLFIITISPSTLLGDFGRYALASFPAYILGIFFLLKFSSRKIHLLNKIKL